VLSANFKSRQVMPGYGRSLTSTAVPPKGDLCGRASILSFRWKRNMGPLTRN